MITEFNVNGIIERYLSDLTKPLRTEVTDTGANVIIQYTLNK